MTQAKDNPATTRAQTQSGAQTPSMNTGQQRQPRGLSRREDF